MTDKKLDRSIDNIAKSCVAMRWRILNRVVTKVFDDALRPLGLTASQTNILVATWKFGEASPQQVCKVLHMDASTLSRNVERMRTHGWLEVVASDDAREQPFRLTRSGRNLLEKAVPSWEAAQQQAEELLGGEMVELLGKVVARLPADASE